MNPADALRFISALGVDLGVVIGSILGAFIAYNIILALFRLCILEPSRACVLLVAESMCQAVGGKSVPERELVGLQALLPWPHPRRLAQATRDLQGSSPGTLVTVLAHRRLLPTMLVPFAAAAERLGPGVLEGWFRNLGGTLLPRRPQTRRMVPTLMTLYVLFGIGLFFIRFIEPRWDAILTDLGITDRSLRVIGHLGGYLPWLEIGTAILIALGCAAWSRWHWLLERRIQAGEIISQALQLRLPEAAIAAALGQRADAPSLAQLCRSQGWQATTADELAIGLAQARQVHARRMLIAGTLFEVLAPLVLAIPVLLYGRFIFGSLLRIIVELNGQ